MLEREKLMNLRVNARTENTGNASVEFKPGKDTMVYHFPIKDFSSEGFGILVRKDSKVLSHIHPGDVLNMVYHPDRASTKTNPISHKTQIKHISEPESGTYNGHLLVGLLILS
jgi:hypothetical protein